MKTIFSIGVSIVCMIVISWAVYAQQSPTIHQPLPTIKANTVIVFPATAKEARSMFTNTNAYTEHSIPACDKADSLSRQYAAMLLSANTGNTVSASQGIQQPSDEQKKNAQSLADAMNDPEIRQKIQSMSPEEKIKFFKSFQQEVHSAAGVTPPASSQPASSGSRNINKNQMSAFQDLNTFNNCISAAVGCEKGQKLSDLFDELKDKLDTLELSHTALDKQCSAAIREAYSKAGEDKKAFEAKATVILKEYAKKHDDLFDAQFASITPSIKVWNTIMDELLQNGQMAIDGMGAMATTYGAVVATSQSNTLTWCAKVEGVEATALKTLHDFLFFKERYQANPALVYNYFN